MSHVMKLKGAVLGSCGAWAGVLLLGCGGPATLGPKSELLPKETPQVFSYADWATVLRNTVPSDAILSRAGEVGRE